MAESYRRILSSEKDCMIKLKLSVVENQDGVDFDINQDELLSSAVDRCLKDYVKEGTKIEALQWVLEKIKQLD